MNLRIMTEIRSTNSNRFLTQKQIKIEFLIRNCFSPMGLLLLRTPIIQINISLTTDDSHLYTYLYITIIFY